MFWRRKNETSKESAKDESPVKPVESTGGEPGEELGRDLPPVDAEDVLDWLAETVRIYGEHAFDVSNASGAQTRECCETWARHLLLGVKPPNNEAAPPVLDDEPESGRTREWPGLRLFLSTHRRGESEYVRESQTNLREAIWAFISGIRRSMLHDQRADDQVNHRIHRLEGALQGNDHKAIKREAEDTISLLAQLMEERKEQHRSEMASLANRLDRMRGQLDAVREEAATDGLTRLYNRAAFDEQLQRAVDFASLFDKPCYLIMLDIDHFKWVNDKHGHPGGDEVLKLVAASLAHSFLRRDDFVARYGGEEFAVLLRGSDLATAETLAERALMAIRELEIELQGDAVRITASAGLAQLLPDEAAEAWVERTDRALYAAKDGGRDQLRVVREANSDGSQSEGPAEGSAKIPAE